MKRILVVRPDAIGDVVLMIPFLNTLKRLYPDYEIYTLQKSYTQALLSNHPAVTQVLIDPKPEKKYQGVRGVFRYGKWLRSFNFEQVYFSYLDGFYAFAAQLAGIPIRIGDGNRVLQRCFLTHPVKQNFRALARHEVEQNFTLLTALNKSFEPDLTMDIQLNESTQDAADTLLKDAGWEGEALIGIHPATGGGNRPWTPLKYAALIQKIHTETNYKCVVTGFGEKEKQKIDLIIQGCTDQPLILYNATSLEQLKGVIKRYTCIIGTDTGPTHIAAALNIPVLCISPTKFVKSLRWGPWMTLNRIVGEPEVCLKQCNPYQCHLMDCLDSITVQRTFKALQLLLNEKDDTSHFEKPSKDRWFRASATVAFVIEDVADLEVLSSRVDQAREEGVRFHIFASSRCFKSVSAKFSSVSSISWFRIWAIISLVIAHDITVLYLFKPKHGFLLSLVRQLSAPKLYVPPVKVFHHAHESSETLVDFSLQALS